MSPQLFVSMKKEKKIEINYIKYIKKQYVPSTHKFKAWINSSMVKDFVHCVNLIFVGDRRMRTLNNKFLKNDKPTNVLTFPYTHDKELSGDIILCPNIINKEAKEFGFSYNFRWAHMIVHSMLHLQGYTHKTNNERLSMENMEVKLLKNLDFGNPYVRN